MRNSNCLFIGLFLSILMIDTAYSQEVPRFVGEVKLGPPGCKQQERCYLLKDFGFVDKRKNGWKVNAGEWTDGASIPRWAQRFVGEPYREEYIKASVIHDYYSRSRRPVYSWWKTQRMFYEALRLTGVAKTRAGVLYAGVLIGAPKWFRKAQRRPCDLGLGVICIQSFDLVEVFKPATYETAEFKMNFVQIKEKIEQAGELSADQIDDLVRPLIGNDVYFVQKSQPIMELRLQESATE